MASAFVCDDGRNAPACKACSAPIYVAPGTRGRKPHFCGSECRPAKGPPRTLLTDRDCAVCGVTFKPLNSRATCCGTACAKAKADATRSANAAARNLRHCQTCAAPFIPTRNSKGLYCSRACQAQGRRKPKQKATRTVAACAVCATAFVQTSSVARLCSAECRKEDARRKSKALYDAAQGPRLPRSCSCCGVSFTPAHGGTETCSKACRRKLNHRARKHTGKNHRKRARYHGVAYEPVNRLKLFERDRWRCQVCGVKTPKRLMATCEPNAPEMDHRIPMAMGGPHTWANCQTACRKCNAQKGATIIVGQLPLFADAR